ncbi:MAG: hypothetical protein HY551_07780 [Elusimicrobia bacterium]|nr:hypothetical protein [Elusimicrobiota bacterium]
MNRRYVLGVLVALPLAAHLYLGVRFIRSEAATYDEAVHLASGYSYWAAGTFRLNSQDHPPLAKLLAAAPLLQMRPDLYLHHPHWLEGRQFHYADMFLYRNRVGAERMLNAARLVLFLVWTALLGAGVLICSRRAAGDVGMAAAAVLYAFCPAFLSNAPLVTTDMAAATWFFLSVWLLAGALSEVWDSGERSSGAAQGGVARFGRRWVPVGVCVGLGYASKFNMIVLVPILAATAALDWVLRPIPKPRVPWKWILAASAVAAGTLAAVYKFDQLPRYWEGLSATLWHTQQGRSAFFMGRHSTQGFLLYFPVALFIKTPLPVWILAAAGLVFWWRGRRGVPGHFLWWSVPPSLYFAAALLAKTQIGYRHVLPVVPFILLWSAYGAARLWNFRSGRFAAAALGAWLVGSVLRVHPHYLAYFNETVGGPSQGYRYLADSNLDWGQGLKSLAREVGIMGGPPVYLSYFGSADPSAYGLKYVPVGFVANVERNGDAVDPSASGRVLFAVSATNLQAVYYADKSIFDWLKERRPVRVIDHSIFLYDLTQDAQGCRHLIRLLELSGRPDAARALAAKWKDGVFRSGAGG